MEGSIQYGLGAVDAKASPSSVCDYRAVRACMPPSGWLQWWVVRVAARIRPWPIRIRYTQIAVGFVRVSTVS